MTENSVLLTSQAASNFTYPTSQSQVQLAVRKYIYIYIYINIYIIIFFYTKIIWNTETKSSQIFNYTQVTNEDVKPPGSNYMANKLRKSLTF